MGELINTNCPNCGAAIQVNPDYPNKMFCQYCGTSFMVKDVINNYTVINNFNQAASTYEDNIKKRNAYVKELEKEVLYFSQKKDIYTHIDTLKDADLSQLYSIKGNGTPEIKALNGWGIASMITFIILSLCAIKNLPLCLGFVGFSFVGMALIIVSWLLRKRKNKETDLKIENMEKYIDSLNQELQVHYNLYKDCLVGFEYTHPDKITTICELVKSGRADNPKEAIDIMVKEGVGATKEEIADKMLEKYLLSDWNRMLAEYCHKTNLDLPKGAAILRERAKLKHLM